eukprot:GEMP01037264.1.p1 GENE.GEMP01037264.1~~GEMP01037264.1.p1  ORF type:complete len:234 (+),score=26.02 GEMP01037264.1:179-880(+)
MNNIIIHASRRTMLLPLFKRVAKQSAHAYNDMLIRRPLCTNVMIAGALGSKGVIVPFLCSFDPKLMDVWGVECSVVTRAHSALGFIGDIMCQKVVERNEKVNWQRAGAFVFFCAYYQGGVMNYIYNWYSCTLTRYAITSTQGGIITSLVDNFIHVPLLYIPSYYFTVGLLQGGDLESCWEKLRSDIIPTVCACWIVWLPLQALNFSVVPMHLRVAFVNVGCLAWNVILDSLSQ